MKRTDFIFIIKYALIGTVLAGLYGMIHDQITFTISPEYFTKIKFKQFSYANVGVGDRFFVATIGFLATWWVGFFIGWFLSRTVINTGDEIIAAKKVKLGFIIVFVTTLIVSFSVGLYSFLVPDFYSYNSWKSTLDYYNIKVTQEFMRVVYIHYGSYSGGLLGLLIAFLVLKFNKLTQ